MGKLLKTVERHDLWVADHNLIGEIETGRLYEQAMSVTKSDGDTLNFRRIEIQLHESTRDGDEVVYLVTNLPKRISALTIADLYRNRRSIETTFQEMAENLEGEIQTLGYPKAKLFGFWMALASFNLMSVVRAAVWRGSGRNVFDVLCA